MESTQIADELNVGRATHEGMTGKSNEDAFAVLSWKLDGQRNLHMGVVADGVGGQIAGEVASRLAVQSVKAYFDSQDQISNISGHLEQAIVAANETVYQASHETPAYRGMSTTVAIAAIADGHLYTAHVGDSRIYLLRDGRLRQISTDHTWAQEAIEAGLLTPEQAKTHPNRNVIRRHLGGSLQVEVDHRLVLQPGQSAEEAHANQGMALRAGDTLLICSDGLTDMVDDQAILESLSTHYFKLGTAAQELVDRANRAGGKDNITLVLLQVPPTEAPPLGTALATAPAVAARAEAGARRWRLPLVLTGGALVTLLLVVAVGAVLLFGRSRDGQATPSATTAPVVAPGSPEATASLEPPATAAILATSSGGSETPTEATPVDTPVLIPTQRSTFTPTATRRPPSPTPTVTNTPTSTPGFVPPPPGPPAPPPASATPQTPATNTPEPPPTNTPEPQPTNTQPSQETLCNSCMMRLAALGLEERF